VHCEECRVLDYDLVAMWHVLKLHRPSGCADRVSCTWDPDNGSKMTGGLLSSTEAVVWFCATPATYLILLRCHSQNKQDSRQPETEPETVDGSCTSRVMSAIRGELKPRFGFGRGTSENAEPHL